MPYAIQVPIMVAGVLVNPGDIVFVDPREGIVSIPSLLIQDVLKWLENRGDEEDKIKEMVQNGSSVKEAFARYR